MQVGPCCTSYETFSCHFIRITEQLAAEYRSVMARYGSRKRWDVRASRHHVVYDRARRRSAKVEKACLNNLSTSFDRGKQKSVDSTKTVYALHVSKHSKKCFPQYLWHEAKIQETGQLVPYSDCITKTERKLLLTATVWIQNQPAIPVMLQQSNTSWRNRIALQN